MILDMQQFINDVLALSTWENTPFIYSCIFAGQQTTITNLLGKGETRRGCSALRIHLILEYRPSILTQLTAESQKPPFFFSCISFCCERYRWQRTHHFSFHDLTEEQNDRFSQSEGLTDDKMNVRMTRVTTRTSDILNVCFLPWWC